MAANDMNFWACQKCTFDNPPDQNVCNICYTPQVKNKISEEGKWICSACTCENEHFHQRCQACFKSKSVQVSETQWLCEKCHFWNDPQIDKCFRCLADHTPNSSRKGTFNRQTSKDDSYKPHIFDFPKDKSEKDDLRSSLRAGDLIMWMPGKLSPISETRRKSKYTDETSGAAKKDGGGNKAQWTCHFCSKLHSISSDVCSICGTPKPDIFSRSRHNKIKKKRNLISQQSVKADDRRKNEERAAMAKWAKIVQDCRKGKFKFTDEKFPPGIKSLYGKKSYGKNNPTWLRCQSLRNGNREDEKLEWTVYRKPTSPDDIRQGFLGNCWYLSALAVLAYREDLLEKIILTKTFCPEGAYMVRLCKDGYWKIILIDDLFPTDDYKRLLYSRAKKKQLWVPLIEKAAAKIHGCYEALASGRVIEALSLLTGEPCERIDLHETDDGRRVGEVDKDLIWAKLLYWRQSKFLMGTSCGSGKMQNVDHAKYKSMGLIANHAYSLLDVQDVQHNRLVKIRNPWGSESWNGNWSDKSSKWNNISSSRKDALQLNGNKNGIFWMDFNDFTRYFDGVDICKARSYWHELRLKGTFPPHAAQPWKFYKLGIVAETQMEIGLFQKSLRGGERLSEPLVDLMVIVLEDSDEGFGFKRVVDYSGRSVRSFNGCEVTLSHGKYTIACLAFKHWRSTAGMSRYDLDQLNRDFVLTIHSSRMIFTDEIDTHSFSGYGHLLADTIIQLAVNKGKVKKLKDGIKTYSISSTGDILVFENSTKDQFAHFECDYSRSSYLVSNRGTFVTKDCIRPRYRQVINILSPTRTSGGWCVSFSYSYLLLSKRGLQGEPPGVEHVPEITQELAGLYSPRPFKHHS